MSLQCVRDPMTRTFEEEEQGDALLRGELAKLATPPPAPPAMIVAGASRAPRSSLSIASGGHAREGSSGSVGRASAAAPRLADFEPAPSIERIDRDREEVCLSFCQKVGEALRTLCS